MSAIQSVILASAQSVAKVYVIGAVGYAAVVFPRRAPLLPAKAVGTLARFGFNVLVIPLIYSVTASSVSPDSLGDYWFLVVGALFVLGISYLTATLLAYCIPIQNPRDFCALRISATFPNIVALPILIFPSLCEYSVVYEGLGNNDNDTVDAADLRQQCVDKSTTMIFCYFFSWSLTFWSLGYPQLMAAARMKSPPVTLVAPMREETTIEDDDDKPSQSEGEDMHSIADEESRGTEPAGHLSVPESTTRTTEAEEHPTESRLVVCGKAARQTITSPPFLAMVAGFVTGCIPPLQSSLFEPGGALRFLGAAVQTLGQASSPMSTMVVAASLVPPRHPPVVDNSSSHQVDRQAVQVLEENPIMSDPNFGPHHQQPRRRRASIQEFTQSFRRSSVRLLHQAVPRSSPEMRRLLLWFVLSRLIISPAVVVAAMVGLDCGGILKGVPDLAKLVVIINSALPGALIVVVLLKSDDALHDSAAAVAKIYLPSYLLSIVTIAAWTALGLWISLPGDDGKSFCGQ